MADNAFYPGYMPGTKDVNPMFPGYFPGQPVSRIPRVPNYAKGFDYAYDFFTKGIDELELELTNQGKYLPGWVNERVIDDFKKQLKATIKGPENSVSVEELDEYDANALPGAFGLSVNLNPVDWVKDPKKQAKIMLKDWGKTVINWGDVETRIKENLWTQVLRENPNYTRVVGVENFMGTAPMAEATANRIIARMKATGKRYGMVTTGSTNPLALFSANDRTKSTLKHFTGRFDATTGQGIFEKNDQTLEDKMASVGGAVINFERASTFAPSRDKAFDVFQSKVFDAIEFNLEDTVLQGTIQTDASLKTAYETFKAKRTLAENMENISTKYEKGYKKELSKLYLEGNGSYLASNSTKLKSAIDEGLANLDRDFYNSATKISGLSTKEAEALKKITDPYKKHLENLKQAIEDVDSKLGSVGTKATPAQRASALAGLRKADKIASGGFKGKGLTGGDVVVDSMQRSLLRHMSDDLLSSRKNGLGDLVSQLEAKHGELGISRLRAYVDRLRYERDSDTADTVIKLLEKGNLMEALVWNRARKLLIGLVPSMYVESLLTKLSYFGLIIKDDDRFEKHAWIRGASGIRKLTGANLEPPGKLFGNWIRLKEKHEIALGSGATARTQKISFNGSVWGGVHFKGVEGLFGIKTLVDKGYWTPEAFGYMIAHIDANTGFTDVLLDKLKLLNNNRMVDLPGNVTPEAFAKDIVALREWVTKNKKRLGTDAKITDDAFWMAFVTSLHRKGGAGSIDITRKFAGLLEKLWAKLNYVQNVVLAKVGKFLAPISYIKTIITEAVSEAVLKLIDVAAGAASGGTLAVVTEALGRVIKPLIRFVVRRTVDAAEVIVKGLLKGDFFLIFKTFEKTILKFLRVVLIATAIPFFIMLLISTLFFGNTLTTYSPIDPTTPSYIFTEDYSGGMNYNSGPGIPPPDVPPITTGGSLMCTGTSLGRCIVSYPSYGTNIGHGTNHYWSGSAPCRYSVPYLPFPDLRWSVQDSVDPTQNICIGSCEPTWDPTNVCALLAASRAVPAGWNAVDFYGFAADYQTTCAGNYARAIIAPDIANITEWTVIVQGNANYQYDGYFFANLQGTGDHVVLLHLMHLDGYPCPTGGSTGGCTFATGELIQTYWAGYNHVHVEVIVDGVPQKPEDVFACN